VITVEKVVFNENNPRVHYKVSDSDGKSYSCVYFHGEHIIQATVNTKIVQGKITGILRRGVVVPMNDVKSLTDILGARIEYHLAVDEPKYTGDIMDPNKKKDSEKKAPHTATHDQEQESKMNYV
jgi:hypothetical protein